jgi:hypothetical protein
MFSCEKKIGNSWEKVPAVELPRGTRSPEVRCCHCHGEISVFKPWFAKSIRDHFEHRIRKDSEGCRGGWYHDPKTEHKMSETPIT